MGIWEGDLKWDFLVVGEVFVDEMMMRIYFNDVVCF